MKNQDTFKEQKLKQLQLFVYVIPVLGFFPALWTLYSRQGNDRQQRVSRLSVSFTLSWLLAYILLWTGAVQTSDLLSLRLLFINSLVTSGYFLVCIVMMIRLWQGKITSRAWN